MNDLILENFLKLEKNKKEILAFLESQDPKDLERSKEGSWCMIQTMRHIQLSEYSITTYLEKKIQAGDDMPERTLSGRVALSILFLVFFFRIKFKAPKALQDPPITSLNELERDWKLTRERMKSFITNYPEKWQKKAIYKHPAGMRINLTDTIRFFNAHLKHHIHQIDRIKSSLGN